MYKGNNFWFYEGSVFEDPDMSDVGFVYVITNNINGKKYIGKKLFWKKVRYKTKPKIRMKQSNWKSYFGSSKLMLEDIVQQGEQDFHREIIRICKSKGEMSYCELKEQIDKEVLLKDNYYNNFIGCKIHGSHVTGMKKNGNK